MSVPASKMVGMVGDYGFMGGIGLYTVISILYYGQVFIYQYDIYRQQAYR